MIQKLWTLAASRGPARGTWAHQIGGIVAAVILGLAFWWARSNGV